MLKSIQKSITLSGHIPYIFLHIAFELPTKMMIHCRPTHYSSRSTGSSHGLYVIKDPCLLLLSSTQFTHSGWDTWKMPGNFQDSFSLLSHFRSFYLSKSWTYKPPHALILLLLHFSSTSLCDRYYSNDNDSPAVWFLSNYMYCVKLPSRIALLAGPHNDNDDQEFETRWKKE